MPSGTASIAEKVRNRWLKVDFFFMCDRFSASSSFLCWSAREPFLSLSGIQTQNKKWQTQMVGLDHEESSNRAKKVFYREGLRACVCRVGTKGGGRALSELPHGNLDPCCALSARA